MLGKKNHQKLHGPHNIDQSRAYINRWAGLKSFTPSVLLGVGDTIYYKGHVAYDMWRCVWPIQNIQTNEKSRCPLTSLSVSLLRFSKLQTLSYMFEETIDLIFKSWIRRRFDSGFFLLDLKNGWWNWISDRSRWN